MDAKIGNYDRWACTVTMMILALPHDAKFNARDIMRLYHDKHQSKYDSFIDWHEFSNWLDILHTNKAITIDHIDSSGMCVYKHNL